MSAEGGVTPDVHGGDDEIGVDEVDNGDSAIGGEGYDREDDEAEEFLGNVTGFADEFDGLDELLNKVENN